MELNGVNMLLSLPLTRCRIGVLRRALLALAMLFCCVRLLSAAEEIVVEIEADRVQTAVLDPVQWDTVLTNERYFDAIRPMLVRFPGLAEAVHAELEKGFEITGAELILTWTGQEGARPERGRHGWGAEQAYEQNPGRWSAVIRPLMQVWSVDNPNFGPTFNASVNGVAYWSRGGARGDGKDRFARSFGPLPLHNESKTAAFDITPLLDDESYGETLGHRLRALAERGFQVHKHELYDLSYGGQEGFWFDGYAWRTCTGYMKIQVDTPRLVVRMRRTDSRADAAPLPPAADVAALAERLRAEGPTGSPSIFVPDARKLAEQAEPYLTRPQDMPQWQWQRIEELRELGGGVIAEFNNGLLGGNPQKYERLLRSLLTMPPRHWRGHGTTMYALGTLAYQDILPPGVVDHMKLYWQAWVHPDVADVENPRTRSYYRSYNVNTGTMNFNFNSTAGALMAGQMLDAPNVIASARHGLENLLLRTFLFYDGLHHEQGDTYYQAISLSAMGAMRKFAEAPVDRVMALVGADWMAEPLISTYHPELRRLSNTQNRGRLLNQALFQDAAYHLLHALSKDGVLMHLEDARQGKQKLHGVEIIGTEGFPAQMALVSPYIGHDVRPLVDDKTTPWRTVARHWSIQPQWMPETWFVNYHARNYFLSSRDEAGGVSPIVAQWRRSPQRVNNMEELSTLAFGFGVNGQFFQYMGAYGVVHHNNKLVALKTIPPKGKFSKGELHYCGMTGIVRPDEMEVGYTGENAAPVHSMHASAAIITFGDTSSREVWVNDRRADDLCGGETPADVEWPASWPPGDAPLARMELKDGDVITMCDGVTYLAITPFAAGPATRLREVEIAFTPPLMLIHAYVHYDEDNALDIDAFYEGEQMPTAGFVVEMADAEDFQSFDAFREHIHNARLERQWDELAGKLDVLYASGDDTLEIAFKPGVQTDRIAHYPWAGKWTPHMDVEWGRFYPNRYTLERRINGKFPYLPEGIYKDTPWSTLGTAARLEKNGAILQSEENRRAALWVIPETGVSIAYNPVPDPQSMMLRTASGVIVEADGRWGVARILVDDTNRIIEIDHALRDEDTERADVARHVFISGMHEPFSVMLNGEDCTERLIEFTMDGEPAYALTLDANAPTPQNLNRHLSQSRSRYETYESSSPHATFLRSWHIVGPFSGAEYQESFRESYPPEDGVDLDAVYEEVLGEEPVGWQVAGPDEPAEIFGSEPFDLLPYFSPNTGVVAYAYSEIESDAERAVTFRTGSDGWLAIWLNGEKVLDKRGYRPAYIDQDCTTVNLKQGRNTVLLKLRNHYEGWRFYFRVTDDWGFPLTEGIAFGVSGQQ